MVSEFRKTKYEVLFKQMDYNRNGIIDYGDFLGHVYNIQKAMCWGNDHEHFLRLTKAKEEYWNELIRIVNPRDKQSITIDEWIMFCDRIAEEVNQTKKVPDWLTRIIVLLFDSMDLDGNGEISPKEYELYLRSLESEASAEEVFWVIDLNSDGIISLSELEELLYQWITSENPDDPGNLFLAGHYQ